jgi:hypothetical protein
MALVSRWRQGTSEKCASQLWTQLGGGYTGQGQERAQPRWPLEKGWVWPKRRAVPEKVCSVVNAGGTQIKYKAARSSERAGQGRPTTCRAFKVSQSLDAFGRNSGEGDGAQSRC